MPLTTHPLAAEDLMAYLDDELQGTERLAAEEHLKSCWECQALAAEFREVALAFQAWSPGSENTGDKPFRERWAAAVRSARRERDESKKGRRWVLQHKWLAGSCSVAALLVALWLWPHSQPTAGQQYPPRDTAFRMSRGDATLEAFSSMRDSGGVGGMFYQQAARPVPPPAANSVAQGAPKVVCTASLRLTTTDFVHVHARLDRTLAAIGGYAAQLNELTPSGEARTFTASLRVPASRLEETMAKLRQLGRVQNETQNSEEVTDRVVNVEARLKKSAGGGDSAGGDFESAYWAARRCAGGRRTSDIDPRPN